MVLDGILEIHTVSLSYVRNLPVAAATQNVELP
jgi:hypothetical protein